MHPARYACVVVESVQHNTSSLWGGQRRGKRARRGPVGSRHASVTCGPDLAASSPSSVDLVRGFGQGVGGWLASWGQAHLSGPAGCQLRPRQDAGLPRGLGLLTAQWRFQAQASGVQRESQVEPGLCPRCGGARRPRNAHTAVCPTWDSCCPKPGVGGLPTHCPRGAELGIRPRVGLARRDVPALPPGGGCPSSGKFRVPGPPVASPGPGVDSAGVSRKHGLQPRCSFTVCFILHGTHVIQERLGRIQEPLEPKGWKHPDPQTKKAPQERPASLLPQLLETPSLPAQPLPPQWTVDGLLPVWGPGVTSCWPTGWRAGLGWALVGRAGWTAGLVSMNRR